MKKEESLKLKEDINDLKKKIELLLDNMDSNYFNRRDNSFDLLAERFQETLKEFEVLCKSHPDFTEEKLQKRKRSFFNEFTANISSRSYEILKECFNFSEWEFETLAYRLIDRGERGIFERLKSDFPVHFNNYLEKYRSGDLFVSESAFYHRNFIEFAIKNDLDVRKMIPSIRNPIEGASYLSDENIMAIDNEIKNLLPEKMNQVFLLCSSKGKFTFLERALLHHGKIPEIKALIKNVDNVEYLPSNYVAPHGHKVAAYSILIKNFEYDEKDLKIAFNSLRLAMNLSPSLESQPWVVDGVMNLMESFFNLGYSKDVSKAAELSKKEIFIAHKNRLMMERSMEAEIKTIKNRSMI